MGNGVDGLEESHELPTVPDSIAAARSIVLGLGTGLPQCVRDDAALLVSELMSNTVRHGGDTALLTATLHDGLLRVAVHDDGAGLPAMQERVPDLSTTSGRGLQIVDRVADRWGVELDDGGPGKTVWFQLDAAAAPHAVADGASGATHDVRSDVRSDVPGDETSVPTEEREDRSAWS